MNSDCNSEKLICRPPKVHNKYRQNSYGIRLFIAAMYHLQHTTNNIIINNKYEQQHTSWHKPATLSSQADLRNPKRCMTWTRQKINTLSIMLLNCRNSNKAKVLSNYLLGLLQDLVGKAAEIKSIPFSRLLSYWKKRVSTTLQRENALFILNTSATILSSTYRYNPATGVNCEDALLESVHHEE